MNMSLVLPTFECNDTAFWGWGVLGRAAEFNDINQFSITDVIDADFNFTISAWFKPDSSFDLDIAGNAFSYTHGDPGSCQFLGATPVVRLSPSSQWMHIAITVSTPGQGVFYVDGQKQTFAWGYFSSRRRGRYYNR
jgi:hypothetical protein